MTSHPLTRFNPYTTHHSPGDVAEFAARLLGPHWQPVPGAAHSGAFWLRHRSGLQVLLGDSTGTLMEAADAAARRARALHEPWALKAAGPVPDRVDVVTDTWQGVTTTLQWRNGTLEHPADAVPSKSARTITLTPQAGGGDRSHRWYVRTTSRRDAIQNVFCYNIVSDRHIPLAKK